MKRYCPECWSDDQLKQGDGYDTPPLYCDRCGIGWDDLPDLGDLMFTVPDVAHKPFEPPCPNSTTGNLMPPNLLHSKRNHD